MLEITIHVKAPELADALRALAGGIPVAQIPTVGISEPRLAAMKTELETLARQAPATAVAPQTPAVPATPQVPVAPQAPAAPATPATPVTSMAPTAEPDYTHEQLGRAAAAYLDQDAANLAKLQELLGLFNVQAITQLSTPAIRTAFANALRGLGAQV